MPDLVARIALVGTGAHLVRAVEALARFASVSLVVVADSSGNAEIAQLARSLKIRLISNPMEIFRTNANVIMEVNGDRRQYERLLAVKPEEVEVLSARGSHLLIDLLQRRNGGPEEGPAGATATLVVAADRPTLYTYLTHGFAGVRGVEVTIERRQGDRRQRLRAQASERRHGDRRQQPRIEPEFGTRGFIINRRAGKDAPP